MFLLETLAFRCFNMFSKNIWKIRGLVHLPHNCPTNTVSELSDELQENLKVKKIENVLLLN